METLPLTQQLEILEQDAQSDAALAQVAQEFETFATGGFSAEHEALFYENSDYIKALFDEFAPSVDPTFRMRAVLLGGISLTFMGWRYGKDESSPKVYGGAYEENVLSTYHHMQHPKQMLRGMFEYAARVNAAQPGTFQDEDFAIFAEIAGFHDAVMGSGRRVDEVQSWLLYKNFLEAIGFAVEEGAKHGICATIWDDQHKMQFVDTSEEASQDQYIWLKRATAVGDLISLFQRRGPYEALCVWVEDLCKKQNDQIFAKEAAAAGFSFTNATVEDCFKFVDSNEVLKQRLGKALLGNIVFMRDFKPADPNLDQYFPDRPDNVRFFEKVSERFNKNGISPAGVFRAARLFKSGYLQAA